MLGILDDHILHINGLIVAGIHHGLISDFPEIGILFCIVHIANHIVLAVINAE